ncbi:response regulator transcription factor [Micromonospora sp. NBC_01813]|uniref:response regulator transcription factor n=1 Tax=Micromonospora sp. NBC_01813 TaxID=2975988 RepID=UPI002DDC38F2|nr:LuxR C-terminal-related transcriptional regulator [Micromonospora sp. NBC_01813]WSA08266.1 LuxR C-terminal-related transcriptional regulator [Micromonospora sp. NBC_01813]
MRKVLVCVRTVAAAQNITAAAARLGLSGAVRTAVSEPEVMLRLSERSAEIVLADTALARPDSASFTRRVLARSPGSVIVLFGGEDPQVASAAMAAGARGLIRNADDLVSVVAKTLLLLAAPGRHVPALLTEQSATTPVAAVAAPTLPEVATVGAASNHRPTTAAGGADPAADPVSGADPTSGADCVNGGDPTSGSTVVPNQRDDAAATNPASGPAQPTTTATNPIRPADPARLADPTRKTDPAGAATSVGPVTPLRRVGLTERELQVLRGMSEGKSNGEIGRELFVSEDTVKTHARRLFRKLGARDRAHAVATGFRSGLVA